MCSQRTKVYESRKTDTVGQKQSTLQVWVLKYISSKTTEGTTRGSEPNGDKDFRI